MSQRNNEQMRKLAVLFSSRQEAEEGSTKFLVKRKRKSEMFRVT